MTQKLIIDFFPVVKRRGKNHCCKCKRKFVSKYHLNWHKVQKTECVSNPDGHPYCSVECLDDASMLCILDYLPFRDLVNFSISMPKVLYYHGFKGLWQRRSRRYYEIPPNVFSNREYVSKVKWVEGHLTERRCYLMLW